MRTKTASDTDAPARKAARPRRSQASTGSAGGAGAPATDELDADALDAAILRYLRHLPNRVVDLGPLATELGVEPVRLQLAVERLGRRRMVVVPFIEPGTAGGAELTATGLRWLLEREGGRPADIPDTIKVARKRMRTEEDSPRLPRDQVYRKLPQS